MRGVILKALMGIMLFCSVESAVDSHAVVDHHDEHPHHAAPQGPDPAGHDGDDDCQHVCHCAAHMPSIAIVNDGLSCFSNPQHPGAAVIVSYLSRTVAPLLRPPNG